MEVVTRGKFLLVERSSAAHSGTRKRRVERTTGDDESRKTRIQERYDLATPLIGRSTALDFGAFAKLESALQKVVALWQICRGRGRRVFPWVF